MSELSNTKKSYYNILTDIIGKVLIIIISIVIPKLYIDYYGSQYNGLVNSLNGIFVYLNLLEAGIGSASIQALYKPITEKNYAKINEILSATRFYYLRNGLFFLTGLLVVSFGYPSFSNSDISYWRIIALIILTGIPYILKFFFQGKYTVLLIADNRLYILNIITNGFHFLANIAKIIFIINDYDILIVQAAFAVVYFCQIIFIHLYIKKKYKDVSYYQEPDLYSLAKSRAAMVHELAYAIFNNTDVILLTYFLSLEVVSVYSVYNMIFSQVMILLQSITIGTNSGLAQLMVKDFKKYVNVYEKFEYLFQSFVTFIMISVGVMTIPFIRLYTQQATDVEYVIYELPLLFTTIQILSLLRWPGVGAIKAAGMFKETKNRAMIEVIINISSSLILINYMGMVGVLWGTILALIYRTLDVIIFTRKYILLKNYILNIIRTFILIFVGLILYFFESKIDLYCSNYVEFFYKGILVLLLNLLLLIIYLYITDKDMVLKFLSNIFKKGNKI